MTVALVTAIDRRSGTARYQDDLELPGGEISGPMLVVAYNDGVGYPGTGVGFDHIEAISKNRMVLRGLYGDEPVEYDRVDALP